MIRATVNNVKRLMRRAGALAAPKLIGTIQAIRARRHVAQLQEQWGLANLNQELATQFGHEVRRGPFRGMRLLLNPSFAAGGPMLLGTHELETFDAIEESISRKPAVVINVGCAEGYVAVGYARRLPDARIIAYDIDPYARKFCRRLAEENSVSANVSLHGWCDHKKLNQNLKGGTSLVFSDCEGFEDVLLDPQACPLLTRAEMIVEVHDFAVPGATERLQRRFADSHQAAVIEIRPRNAADYEELQSIAPQDRARVLAEYRNPDSRWLHLVPRA